MRQATRTFAVLFLAASSVYSAQASGERREDPANPTASAVTPEITPEITEVGRVLEDTVREVSNGREIPQPGKPGASDPIPVEGGGKERGLREGQPVRPGQVNVSETGTVEIHVVDANLLEVLRMLAAQSQKNIVASKEVRGVVTANLYDVTIREALDAILQSNGFAYREKGNFVYVYTIKELAEIEKASRRTQTEVFRLFYTPAANAVNMIKPVLSSESQTSFTTAAVSGIDSGTQDVGGNSHATDDLIVVTDFPENLEKVREILKEVDRRPQQILIEATILRAALTEDNALGVDFNILAGVNFANILTNGNGGQFLGGPVENPLSPNSLGRGAGQGGTGNNFTQGINNGLRVGFVSDNISVFLAALEGVTDTTVLANPKVLALNKQKGEIIVGRRDGYLTTTVTASSSVQTVEFLDTGTRLIFRPFIGDDGYIRMEVHPEDSSGGLTASSNLPFKITTEVTSNIMVKDGNTVVIGGLFRESSDSSKNQVPLLGSIPVAGALFRNQRDRTAREEVIILLTPHIIKDDSGFSKEAEASRKDWEKLRVGVRKGMMPTGRERLAESSFEKAVAEMAKPNPDSSKAIWHLDIATNLNPKFHEAISMREKLTGVELSVVDNSSIRGFIRRRAMAESGMTPATQPASRRLPDNTPPPQGVSDESPRAGGNPADTMTVLQPPAPPQPTNLHPANTPAVTVSPVTPFTPASPPPVAPDNVVLPPAPAANPSPSAPSADVGPTSKVQPKPAAKSLWAKFWSSPAKGAPAPAPAPEDIQPDALATQPDNSVTITKVEPAIVVLPDEHPATRPVAQAPSTRPPVQVVELPQ